VAGLATRYERQAIVRDRDIEASGKGNPWLPPDSVGAHALRSGLRKQENLNWIGYNQVGNAMANKRNWNRRRCPGR